jgi:hypothetical protein
METIERVYEILQANLSHPPEVWVEDLVKYGCGYRHYLALIGADTVEPERAQDIILRESAHGLRGMVGRYLREAFDTFEPGYTASLRGAVLVDIIGVLEGALVEVVPLPTKTFAGGSLPRSARLAAAVKAHLVGADSAWIILIDRDKQDWSSWKVQGKFGITGEVLERESAYIRSLVDEDGRSKAATASKDTCSRCPYRESCDAEPMGDPTDPIPEDLRYSLDPSLTTQLDTYLWTLNERVREWREHIAPSHFAVTPCDRAVAYGLLGTPQKGRVDPKLRRIFNAGHAFHDVLQAALYWAYPDEFLEEVKMQMPQYRMEGRCDGVQHTKGHEIKSIGSKGFCKLANPKSDHVRQATIYQRGLELDKMEYIYVCKEDGNLKAFERTPDNKVWHKLASRAERIIKNVDEHKEGNGELPPQIVGKDYECRKCKYGWKCRPEMFRTKKQAAARRRFTRR